ncbi:MAG: ACP S-malonyltransferase [Pseudomonadota bacterium]
MTRKSALVVCPGRGTYNKPELGYLARYHKHRYELLRVMEDERARVRQPSLASLDSADRYSVATHTRGDNASLLIHACAMGDFAAIDQDTYDIVAVTGNSMGWYIALACAGAASQTVGAQIVNTMGTYMQEALIGGQLVYPITDSEWKEIPGRCAEILDLLTEVNAEPGHEVDVSIELGGMIVLAGNDEGLTALTSRLEPIDRYPMYLQNHAAFHTRLQDPVSKRGLETFSPDQFQSPNIPMIDGRGHIWSRHASDQGALHQYTFGHQVVETYDFSRAVQVGMREFAPDCILLLGPGGTLGGAIAQSLIAIDWQGLDSKSAFQVRQDTDPILLAMGREDQRALVTGAAND